MVLLKSKDFKEQKIGLRIATFDKLFYDKNDIENLKQTQIFIIANFKERGKNTTKKQMLSSIEKDVCNCECGNKGNYTGEYCGS